MLTLDRYAVFGNPIAHSKSPLIHRLFAEQTQQQIEYDAILAPLDGFPAAAADFARKGGKGFNVTVPFKHQAWDISHKRSERAQRAGAVNTVVCRDDGMLFGDNTDGMGIVRDIQQNLGFSLKGKRILIAGAGGAVRGVIEPIAQCLPSMIVIANRTTLKAVEIAREFSDAGNIQGVGFSALAGERFDLVINGTAASLKNEIPAIPNECARGAFCYDMMYGSKLTPFLQWCKENSAKAIADGLGMLVEQAAEAFFIWRHVRPNTGVVIDKVRSQIAVSA